MSAILATVSRKRENREVALWLLVSRTTDDAAEPCGWGSGAATRLRALPLPLHGLWGWGPGWCPPCPAQHMETLWPATCRAGGWSWRWWLLMAIVSRVLSSEKSWEKVKMRMTKWTKIVKLWIGVNFTGQPRLLEIRIPRRVLGCSSLQTEQGVKSSYKICEVSEDGAAFSLYVEAPVDYRDALSFLALEWAFNYFPWRSVI